MDHYTKGTLPPQEQDDEPAHWGWKLLGAAISMVLFAYVTAWILVGVSV